VGVCEECVAHTPRRMWQAKKGRIGQEEGPRLALGEVSTFSKMFPSFPREGAQVSMRGMSFWVECGGVCEALSKWDV
jgi:hypothetical protein